MADVTISRSVAIAAGLTHFFSGVPCKQGHTAKRFVLGGACTQCAKERNQRSERRAYFSEYNRRPEVRARLRPRNAADQRRERSKLGSKRWRRHLYLHALKRAKECGLPFDEGAVLKLLTDPPTHCPVLGIEFTPGGGRGRRNSAPSLDRILPENGYVAGNIALISFRANRIKSDATLAELQSVVQWLTSAIGACQ